MGYCGRLTWFYGTRECRCAWACNPFSWWTYFGGHIIWHHWWEWEPIAVVHQQLPYVLCFAWCFVFCLVIYIIELWIIVFFNVAMCLFNLFLLKYNIIYIFIFYIFLIAVSMPCRVIIFYILTCRRVESCRVAVSISVSMSVQHSIPITSSIGI